MIPVKVGGLSLTDAPWDAGTIDGWLDSPGAQVPSTPRIRHGDVAGVSRWAGRTIKIEGLLHTRDCDQQQAERDRLVGLFYDGQSQLVEVTHGGVATSGRFQAIDRVDFYPITPTVAEWTLSLYSEEPWLYAATQHVSVAAAGSGIGLVYPLYTPSGVLSYGKPSDATTGVLTNHGTADAWPIFWPRGDMPTGFRIIQDGHVIEWGGSMTTATPVAVDTGRSAVEMAGTDVSHYLSRDDFQPVRPGQSVAVTFEPLGGGTGYLDATIASTYI
ncbi:hypothetical protein [Brachybacterium nesterenkovii]|uniref:hypothetical protein n=1 Tax=Brachybacterium nesterenkovii TaxID=47847 RepID=UPI00321AC8AE